MDGKYCVAGLCLGLDSDADSMFLEIDKITLKEYFDNVDDFFIDNLDDIFPNLDRKFSVFAISHYH